MKKKLTIKYKKKRIKLIAEDCNLWKKFIGLMFCFREEAEILLFSFKRKQKIKIHSFFVFFPFIAVWIDNKNNILDMKIVKPFTPLIYSKKSSYSIVEIPLNKKFEKITNLFFHTSVK